MAGWYKFTMKIAKVDGRVVGVLDTPKWMPKEIAAALRKSWENHVAKHLN